MSESSLSTANPCRQAHTPCCPSPTPCLLPSPPHLELVFGNCLINDYYLFASYYHDYYSFSSSSPPTPPHKFLNPRSVIAKKSQEETKPWKPSFYIKEMLTAFFSHEMGVGKKVNLWLVLSLPYLRWIHSFIQQAAIKKQILIVRFAPKICRRGPPCNWYVFLLTGNNIQIKYHVLLLFFF